MKKSLKYGGFSVAITIITILAVLGVNILTTYLENNKGWRVDFTPTESYTLDNNAVAALKDLDKEIVIYTFIPQGQASNYSYMTQNIAAMFDGASDKVTYENVDPVVNPAKLQSFSTDIKELATFAVVICEKGNEKNYHAFNESELVEYNSRSQKNYFVLQRWITSSIIYLRTGTTQTVYVLTGHGEVVTGEAETMLNRLRRENYEVETVSLASGQVQLKQGDILLVLQPKSDLAKSEYDSIITFLDDNYGKMMFLASRLVNDLGEPLKYYNALLEYFNIKINDGVVAETNERYHVANQPRYITLVASQSHQISSAVRSQNEPIWVSDATSFSYVYDDGLNAGSYTETFENVVTSYASSILVPWDQITDYDENAFTPAVNGIACAYERMNEGISGTANTTTTRIFLCGSQTMGTEDYLGNANIIRNGINWLAGREVQDTIVNIGIDLTSSYVQLSQLEMKIWFACLVIAVPAIIFTTGVIVWIRRKNL